MEQALRIMGRTSGSKDLTSDEKIKCFYKAAPIGRAEITVQ